MSKFGNIMENLDLENRKVQKRIFPEGVTPITPQDICIIPVKIGKIHPTCEKCIYSAIIQMRGQVNELGIGGYMSNQKDPLAPTTHRPSEGVKLREPQTLITADGPVWVCRNRIQGQKGIFILDKDSLPCDQFKEKNLEKVPATKK